MKKNYADMDPLEEIRVIRQEINNEFKTARAIGEYLRSKLPTDALKEPECQKRRKQTANT